MENCRHQKQARTEETARACLHRMKLDEQAAVYANDLSG